MSDTPTGSTPKTTGTMGGAGQGTSHKSDMKSAQDAAGELSAAASGKIRETADAAMSQAYSQADAVKQGAADEISSVGNAFRKASSEMREGSAMERTLAGFADTLADVADGVRGKDFGDMLDDVTRFAKRNPAAFLGGAALIGFAAARMAKASDRNRAGEIGGPRYTGGSDPYMPAGGSYSGASRLSASGSYSGATGSAGSPGGSVSATSGGSTPASTGSQPSTTGGSRAGQAPVTPGHVSPGGNTTKFGKDD